MQTEWVRFNARLPATTYEWLRQQAFNRRRSINAELVERLDMIQLIAETKEATGQASQA